MSTKAKKKRKSIKEVLDEMNKHESGGSGNWFKVKPGSKAIARILPEVGNMELFYVPRGRHFFGKNDKESVDCPSFATDGELDCILCATSAELYAEGETEAAKKWRVRRSYGMNVIVRSKDGDDEIKRWTPGIKVFEMLAAIMSDEEVGDITDPETGCDISISRKGEGLDTTYTVMPRRKSTPLVEDEDELEEILSEAYDFSKALEDLPSNEDLLELTGLGQQDDDYDDDDDYDE